jgi:hypothetical protein
MHMPDITPLIEAINMKNWYYFAGFLLTFAVQIVRKQPKLAALLWNRFPDGYRWLPVIASGAIIGFVGAFQAGESLVQSLQAAIGGAFGVGASAMGFAAMLKESPVKWDGGKGGKEEEK